MLVREKKGFTLYRKHKNLQPLEREREKKIGSIKEVGT